MRFWPFKKKVKTKLVELASLNGPPPAYLQAAFNDALKHPLDDMVWRLVIASPQRHYIVDVGVLTMSAYCDTHEKQGLEKARIGGGQVLNVVFEKNLPLSPEALDLTRFSALAFFDAEFTRGANKGKTYETGWNTLALAVEPSLDKVTMSRWAVRLEYPIGVPDLSFPGGVLNSFR